MSIVEKNGNQYSGFDPRTIPNCNLWLDGSDLSTYTPSYPSNGTVITNWNDKSGAGYNFTSFGSGAAYSSSSNGLSFIPPGAGYTSNHPASVANETLFLVFTTAYNRSSYFVGASGAGGRQVGTYANWTRFGNINGQTEWAAITPENSMVGNSRNMGVSTVTNRSGMGVSVNGGSFTTYTLSNPLSGNTTSTLSMEGTSTSFSGGIIHEVIAYTRVLSTTERQQVEGYLAQKWGIQSVIIASHPYKSIAPFVRLFQPTDYSDCALWLDAADLSTFTPLNPSSGTTITAWRDKSINNLSCVPVLAPSANPITYRTTTGLPSIYINNNNSSLNNTSTNVYLNIPSNIQNGFSNFTYIAVLNVQNNGGVGNSPRLQSWYVNIRDASTSRIQLGTNFFEVNSAGGAFASADEIVNRSVNTRIICTFISDTSRFSWLVNGTPCQIITTTTGTKLSSDVGPTPRIGTSGVDNRNTTGDFYEVMLYNRALPDAERTNIETYLSRKWNVALDNATTSTSSQILLPNDSSISANLQIWNDANSYSTNNQVLTTWINRTGGTASSCTGTVLTNQLNSRPIVRFATTATYSTPSVNYSSYTMFMVARHNGLGANGRILQGPSGQNILYGHWAGYKNVVYINNSPALLSGNGRARLADTLWDIMSHRRVNGGAYNLRFAQSTIYSGSISQAANFTQALINTGGIPGETSTCDIAEIIIYNTTLTDTQIERIENYLNEKWNIYPINRFPFYGSPPMIPVFVPRSLSGLQLWLDAADPSTVTGTTSVTNVVDKSPFNRVLSGASGFSYPNNTFNGTYPSFFNPTRATSRSLGSNASFVLTQPITTFFVGRKNTSTNFFDGYIFDGVNSTNRIAQYGAQYQMFAGSGIGNPSTTEFDNVNVVASSIFNTTSSTLFIQGTSRATGSVGTNSTSSGTRIGNSFGNGDSWVGHICELIIYSGVLTTSQRQQVEGYLAWKWGLQNTLPTSHPYYKFSP